MIADQSAARRALVELVREAFASGLTWSFRLVAVLALGGLVVAVLFVGGSLLARGGSAGEPGELQHERAAGAARWRAWALSCAVMIRRELAAHTPRGEARASPSLLQFRPRIEQPERRLARRRGCAPASRCRARRRLHGRAAARVPAARDLVGRLAGQQRRRLGGGAQRDQLLGRRAPGRRAPTAARPWPATRARGRRRRSARPARPGRGPSRPRPSSSSASTSEATAPS